MLIGDLLFDDNGIVDSYQQLILPFWNACNFYISYANIDDYRPDANILPKSDNQLDKWVLAKLYQTEKAITENMDNYQINHFVEHLLSLVDGITNWYIRRSRRRFWTTGLTEDKKQAYDTLYYVLVNTAKLFAPVAPIISEKIYKILTDDYSVHLADWPTIPEEFKNEELVASIDLVQDIISLARSIRNKNRVKNRQPLSELKLAVSDSSRLASISEFTDVIAEELNVKQVVLAEDVSAIATVKCDPNFNEIRNRYPTRIPDIIKAVKSNKYRIEGDFAILNINGNEESFDKAIILVTYIAKEGLFVASQNGIVVSLDLTITDELRAEGIAREIVRNIQDTRKKIGYEIMDKIMIYSTSTEAFPTEWTDYICSETMGMYGEVSDPDATIKVAIDDDKIIEILIKKA
jgi:isoleucyl-tRNA synthetase